MTSWIHTRWHRLILLLLLRSPRSLGQCHRLGDDRVRAADPKPWGHGDMWDCDGWLLQITSRFNEWKALAGPSSPPVSMKFPFPPLGWTCVVRPVPGITGVTIALGRGMIEFSFLHSCSKLVIAQNLEISECLKLNLYLTDIWDSVRRAERGNRVIKLIRLNCFNFKMI